jgi:predicted acylesterase/phospholipase RssA
VTFLVNLLAYSALAFTWVSFALSAYGFWGGFCAALVAVGGGVGLAAALPGPASVWLAHRLGVPVTPAGQAPAPVEPAGHPGAVVQLWPWVLLAGLVFFLVLQLYESLESPVPIVCFFLFGLVAAYGVATVAVRRAIPVAVTALAFFAILAGVEPYKDRYDGYDDDGGWTPSLDYSDPVDLRKQVEADHTRQRAFDAALRDYDEARKKVIRLIEIRNQRRAFCSEAAPDCWNGNYPTPTFLVVVNNLVEAEKALAVAEASRLSARQELRERWLAMESDNRVVAGRLWRPDLEDARVRFSLGFLREDESNRPLPDDRTHPVDLRDCAFAPAVRAGEPAPLVVVAVSGGGLRSAAWTFTVLRAMEEKFLDEPDPNKRVDFPAHVRIITGASGGMLGAAYYVLTLPARRDVTSADYCKTRKQQLKELSELLTTDDLTPLVKQHVYEDLPNLFSPWPARFDRGKELERAWSRNLRTTGSGARGVLDATFDEIRDDERTGVRPSLVFTPMMVEDGRRLIVSNLDMRHAITNEGNLLVAAEPTSIHDAECYSREALELFRLFPDSARRFRLSSAVRMSASFPFISPAVSLPTRPRRRVVDAGYYDNYGVSLAAAWLFSTNHRVWIDKVASKVLLVQIRDGVDHPQRRLERLDAESSSGVSRSTEELSSPLEGLYNARVGSSSFRNDAGLELLSQFNSSQNNPLGTGQRAGQQYQWFQVVNFELPEPAALSWYLSAGEQKRIREAIESGPLKLEFGNRMDAVKLWWITSRKTVSVQ